MKVIVKGQAPCVALGVALGVGGILAGGVIIVVVSVVEIRVSDDVARVVAGVVARGVVIGLVIGLGITINSWRPIVSWPLLTLWNCLLYRLDKIRQVRITKVRPLFIICD